MNGQSLRVVLARSAQARERLVSTVIAPNKPKTASAPLVAILPIGGFDAGAVNREFFGDGRHKAFLLVAIGKPGEDAYQPRNPRLEYHEVVSTV